MVIIADCGSTKSDWLILKGGRDQELENTIGFNPFFQTTDEIESILQTQLVPKLDAKGVSQLWFYGTGIHDSDRAEIVGAALRRTFPNAAIEVEHDLLAAARATCGLSAGIACILGTGSNSCYYDGTTIRDNVPSLGWLLGDEGSGTHLGKALLRAWFYRELPADLNAAFIADYPEGPSEIKNRIYEVGANAYLASFTQFLGKHKQHPLIQKIVVDSFNEFLDRHVGKYTGHQQVPIHFIGSIAYHFQEILLTCMDSRKLHSGTILRKPIFSLAEFHAGSMKLSK
jgi:hypothetical protein